MPRDALSDKGGIITERGAERVTIRLRIPAGVINADQLEGIAVIARKYDIGIHLTTRQTIELFHIEPASIPDIVADLDSNGTPLGAEKAEVVNITACPGTTRCKYAQIDSVSLAMALDNEHFGKEMPVKCRIAISSCPFSCMGERLNEIGITGIVRPYRIPGTCTGCDSCVQYCPEHAITLLNGSLFMNMDQCTSCGMCIESCPYKIIRADPPAFRMSVGGKRGKNPLPGKVILTVRSEKSALQVVDHLVDWIYRGAWAGSLLADQMDDLDFERIKKTIIQSIPPDEIVEEL